MPTCVLSAATGVIEVSRPPTSTVPRTSAGTACGMSPLRASVSVDLPDPLGPSSSTTSPGAMSKVTEAGVAASSPSWVIARSRTRSSGRRCHAAGTTAPRRTESARVRSRIFPGEELSVS